MVIVDRNSGAVHSDIVSDYSSQETIKTLRRFAALRGWPFVMYSDPGSQLVGASGNMESWFSSMKILKLFFSDADYCCLKIVKRAKDEPFVLIDESLLAQTTIV